MKTILRDFSTAFLLGFAIPCFLLSIAVLHQQEHDDDFLNYIHKMRRLYVTDGYEEYVLIYFEMLGMWKTGAHYVYGIWM